VAGLGALSYLQGAGGYQLVGVPPRVIDGSWREGFILNPSIMERRMPLDWSREEVEATVADYFAMLELEVRSLPLNKAVHRRALVGVLNSRSEQAIEFKHCNISAILNELGFPAIDGYKPRSNYQRLLAEVVAERLQASSQLTRTVAEDVASDAQMPTFDDILAALTEPPRPEPHSFGAERTRRPYERPLPRPAVNYLEREAANRALGLEGELFVLTYERARLMAGGYDALAARVDHVSTTRGDGAGYDVLSYDNDGRERLIEVKTTRYARETPFYVSRNEVEVSRAEAERYHLYRCFGFRNNPRLFTLPGALPATCELHPVAYQASVA
jgi:hypothetical protein